MSFRVGVTADLKTASGAPCFNEAAFDELAGSEGILPALESSHAVAKALQLARELDSSKHIVICLSGRGDKDAAEIRRLKGIDS